MSSSNETIKIFAAILIAGITAVLAGFVAKSLISSQDLEKDAVEIESASATTGGNVSALPNPATPLITSATGESKNVPTKPKLPDPVMHLIASADMAKGQKLSKTCAACHSFDKGGTTRVGPNLWNIVLAPKGAKSGFSYSDSMKKTGGTWSYEALNQFLWKPKTLIPGTKMNYIGLKKPEDRAAIIAWMRTLSDSTPALPNSAEIAAEKTK